VGMSGQVLISGVTLGGNGGMEGHGFTLGCNKGMEGHGVTQECNGGMEGHLARLISRLVLWGEYGGGPPGWFIRSTEIVLWFH